MSTSSEWESVVLPIIQFVADHEDADMIDVGELAEVVGLPASMTYREIERLLSAGYLEQNKWTKAGDYATWSMFEPRVGERGARAIGKWPAENQLESLFEIIEERLAGEPEGDERSRLERCRRRRYAAGGCRRNAPVGSLGVCLVGGGSLRCFGG
jgi:hypothetical protein